MERGRGAIRRLALLCTLAGALAAAPVSSAAEPKQVLARQISAQMSAAGGGSGAWVADGETGKRLYGWADARGRVPASVQKLVTTATALERLEDDGRFTTPVYGTGELLEDGTLTGSLYVRGVGDPSFSSRDLGQLAWGLRAAGVRRVEGRVFGDESYFDNRRGVPSSRFAVSRWVGPLSALSLNHGRNLAGAFQIDPARFVAERLRSALTGRKVRVARQARAGRTPRDAVELATVHSPAIASLVRQTNQQSDNYFAEMLLKGLGARFSRTGSTAAGARVARRLVATLGVRARVVDGSGLSRANSISPRDTGRLLLAAGKEPWFDAFYRSLPLAGKTGTLRKRMRGTAAEGRCRAKTGTLIGVSALAGYCRTRAGRRLAFAVLMNGVGLYTARRAQDRIAAALAAYRG